MNSFNIDFRGESLRVLAVRDGRPQHASLAENVSIADRERAKQTLQEAVGKVGRRTGRVQAILPHSIVKYGAFHLPAMEMADAEKVVRREIAKELGSQEVALGLRKTVSGPGKLDVIAEYALKTDINTCAAFLKECGLKPHALTTSLEGILSAFSKVRPGTEGDEAVIEIGRNILEIVVINNGRLVNYRKVSVPVPDEATVQEKDMDQSQLFKIRMYTIIDALYNFLRELGGASAGEKLSHLWITGVGAMEKGTEEVLSESLGVKSMLLQLFDIENAGMYTALGGLSMLGPEDRIINLLSGRGKDDRSQVVSRTALAAALALFVVLMAGGYTLLGRTERELKEALAKTGSAAKMHQKAAVRNQGESENFKKIMANNRSLYSAFREIANQSPPEIVLTAIDLEKTAETTFLKLTAGLRNGDEAFRNGAVSRFLHALESTGKFRSASPPEVFTTTASAPQQKKQELAVRVKVEVLP